MTHLILDRFGMCELTTRRPMSDTSWSPNEPAARWS
jgi:hypothetical protein